MIKKVSEFELFQLKHMLSDLTPLSCNYVIPCKFPSFPAVQLCSPSSNTRRLRQGWAVDIPPPVERFPSVLSRRTGNTIRFWIPLPFIYPVETTYLIYCRLPFWWLPEAPANPVCSNRGCLYMWLDSSSPSFTPCPQGAMSPNPVYNSP